MWVPLQLHHNMLFMQGITFEEVQQFAQVLDSLRDVETALSMYSAAGASVTQGKGPYGGFFLIVVAMPTCSAFCMSVL